jgi:catechol 2,3-dioxygenase-like lactoylglutathione lyase family enzyme
VRPRTSRLLAAVPALPVSDERRAVTFFEASLGFTELRQGGVGLGILRRDAVEIHLWVPDGRSQGAERYLAGSASCRIEVAGVDELYDACARSGVVHPNARLAATSWDTREFGVLDPDHNLITFFERTATPARVTAGLGWPDSGL